MTMEVNAREPLSNQLLINMDVFIARCLVSVLGHYSPMIQCSTFRRIMKVTFVWPDRRDNYLYVFIVSFEPPCDGENHKWHMKQNIFLQQLSVTVISRWCYMIKWDLFDIHLDGVYVIYYMMTIIHKNIFFQITIHCSIKTMCCQIKQSKKYHKC